MEFLKCRSIYVNLRELRIHMAMLTIPAVYRSKGKIME